jgi:beta-galactosidase
MECGNHEDVRWIQLQNLFGPGIVATADGGAMSASALPYSDQELERAKHPHELPKSSSTVLVLAAKTLGVGSAGCGPRPLPQYVIHAEPITFSTVFRPVAGLKTSPASLARPVLPPRVKPVLVQRGRDGRITLETATPGVTLTCAMNGGSAKTYSEPFEFTDSGTVRMTATREGYLPFVGELTLPAGTKRGDWRVVSASSFEPGEGLPEHAIDGDPQTFWHTRYTGSEPRPPHSLVIDLGKPTKIAGIHYTGRQDMDHGRVRDCEVFVSEDGKTWGEPVAKSQFRNTQEPQTLRLTQPATARFLKVVALSEVAGRAWATVAELEILAE